MELLILKHLHIQSFNDFVIYDGGSSTTQTENAYTVHLF